MGAALTLDEFTMWLHVRETAWSFQGRETVSYTHLSL